jgi:hypothetical protein
MASTAPRSRCRSHQAATSKELTVGFENVCEETFDCQSLLPILALDFRISSNVIARAQ